MAAVLSLTVAGDLDTSRSDLVVGTEYATQKIKQVLQLVKSEWFLDTNLGVPWFEDILVKGASLEVVKGILRKQILSVSAVSSVTSMSLALDPVTRTLAVIFSVKLKTGFVVSDVVEITL